MFIDENNDKKSKHINMDKKNLKKLKKCYKTQNSNNQKTKTNRQIQVEIIDDESRVLPRKVKKPIPTPRKSVKQYEDNI